LKLSAESDSIFFDTDDGTRFHFKNQNGTTTGFSVDRFEAHKIENK